MLIEESAGFLILSDAIEINTSPEKRNGMLAEISDKMPTITVLRLQSLLLSIPVIAGIVRRGASWMVLLVASVFSAGFGYLACHQAFLEGAFSDAIHGEMGRWWIAHSIASAFLPAVVAFVVFCRHVRKHRTIP